MFDNAGQDCCARSRILIEASAYERFLELLEPAVTALRVVAPTREDAEMGPLISAGQRDRVQDYLADADVAITGSRSGRSRILAAADGGGAPLHQGPRLARRGVRTGGLGAAVR